MNRAIVVMTLFWSLSPLAAAHAGETDRDGPVAQPIGVRLAGELGFLAPLRHEVRYGEGGTTFDYVEEGGQDVLFAFARASVELAIFKRHRVTLLYQPLEIRTRETLERDLQVNDQLFPAGTGMEMLYSFPFWRASYTYDLIEGGRHRLGLGGSMQIRNATIDFVSGDGSQVASNRNVGPVPLIRIHWRWDLDRVWFASELDAIYAPIKYFNGGKSDTEGALVDWSLRAGIALPHGVDLFCNLRYLGGGASSDDTYNWLHFLTLSLGFGLKLL